MAEAARKLESFAAPAPMLVAAPAAPVWSGDVHGPVAALHRAIEAGLAEGRLDGAAWPSERPVDRVVRLVSRATGWAVLAAAFAVAAILIF